MRTNFGTIWYHHPICDLYYSYSDGYQRNFATRGIWLDSFLDHPEMSMMDVLKKLGFVSKNGAYTLHPISIRWVDWETGDECKPHEIALEGDWNEFYRLVSKRMETAMVTKDQEIESLYWPRDITEKK